MIDKAFSIEKVDLQQPHFYTTKESVEWLSFKDNYTLLYVLGFINLELLCTKGISAGFGIRKIWHPLNSDNTPTSTNIHSLLWGDPELMYGKHPYIRWDVINGFTTKKFKKVHVR